MTLPLVDEARLTDPHFYAAEPFEVYARLRREDPVFWYEPGKLWGLSKYQDVKFVASHPKLFSSRYGVQPKDSDPPDDGSAVEGDMPRRAELRRRANLALFGAGAEFDYLVASDPPRHTLLRRLVGTAFTPKMVAKLEADVAELAAESIAAIEPGEITDLVEAVALPVPLYVIARMLGVPRADWSTFRRWSDELVQGSTGDQDPAERLTQRRTQLMECAGYFLEQLADRRVSQRDDLLTALVHATIDGERLSETNQVTMVLLLLAAGNETTRNLISGSVKLLAEHDDQRSLLVGQPELIPSAVEEFLRFVSPVVAMARTATESVEIRGRVIERGDFVVLLFQAANRDEDAWPCAETLDVTRRPDPLHVAFGFGEHFCLGAFLARREARIVLEQLLRRFPDVALAGEVKRAPHTQVPGIESMPVIFS